jgi:uncharacterized phage protein (TIGR01671 family)
MREILFRGKQMSNGKWIEGFYFKQPNPMTEDGFPTRHCISDLPPFGAEVIPETVGQYTGLTDKNGKKIFEGDIVKYGDITGIINYSFGCYCVKTNKPDWRGRNNPAIDIVFNEYPNEVKVIGNIHDNPELLKGE